MSNNQQEEEEEDLQFLRDLEEAKRQSLDTFKSECSNHNSKKWWTFNNTDHPASLSMASSSQSQSPHFTPTPVHQTQSPPPPPRPIGFVAPQCFKVLGTNNGNNISTHCDIPSALLTGHQQVGNYKHSGQNNNNNNNASSTGGVVLSSSRSQSFPFGNPLGFSIPTTTTPTPSYGIYPPTNSSTAASVINYHSPMPFMTPPQQQQPTTSNIGFNFFAPNFQPGQIFPSSYSSQTNPQQPHHQIAYVNDALRRNSFSSPSSSNSNHTYPVQVVTPAASTSYTHKIVVPATTEGNLYKNLTEEVRSLTTTAPDDLIDLGQDDGRNVLETFDPLFDKVDLPPQVVPESPPVLPNHSNNNNNNNQSPKIETINKLPPPIRDKQDGNNSNSEVFLPEEESSDETDRQSGPSSIISSNYGWKSDVSLYPSLPPAGGGASTYDTLQSRMGSEAGDPSILYDAYNHFEYLYQVSLSSETSSFCWHPNDASPYSIGAPPSPSRPSEYVSSQSVRMAKARRRSSDNNSNRGRCRSRLYEDITSLKKIAQNDGELIAFVDMLQRLKLSVRMARTRDRYSYIKSPTAPAECWPEGLSLKIVVWSENFTTEPVTFTCDVVSALVEVVIEQALSKMEIEGFEGGINHAFRVKGFDEYLDSSQHLINYRYVQECIKFDEDVRLVLVNKSSLTNGPWARPVDDTIETTILPEEIMPTCNSKVITFTEIAKFLEVIDKESEKLNEKVNECLTTGTGVVNPTPLMQTVKGICVLLGNVQIIEIRQSLQAFFSACEVLNGQVQKLSAGQTPTSRRALVGSDLSSRHSYVEIVKDDKKSLSPLEAQKESVLRSKENVIDSVRMEVEMYSKSFPVSFKMNSPLESSLPGSNTGPKTMSEMLDPFLIRITSLHRAKSDWCSTYLDFFVAIEVFHGTRLMGKQTSPISTLTNMDDHLFFNTVIFDVWVDFEHLPICILPRECRLVFSVYGRHLPENAEMHETTELGWASIQCFDFQGFLVRGNQLLPLWPVGMPQKRLGPAPNSAFSYDLNVPLITIEFPDFGRSLKFPDIPSSNHVTRDFTTLDCNTQLQLTDIIETTTFTKFPAEDREVLWEKRHYLHNYPTALPKVLLSAQFWDFASLSELHKMMENWSPLSPLEALQLLLPCFPDAKVRQTAIKWISEMPDEDLITVLPQLVEALSYETFDLSPLAEFVLRKSMFRFEIAHSLFWNLVSEVGLGKWGVDTEVFTVQFIHPCHAEDETDPRRRRLELMRNSLMTIAYHKWKTALISEFKLMQGLCDVTHLVKLSQPSQRSSVMSQELKRMDVQLFGGNAVYSLPLSPTYIVTSLDVETCICYNSASVPLKINFKSALPEGGIIPILFKQGDDIRQDRLTIQVIRMIEKWWLKDGLDLRVVTFTCVPTGFKQGVVEIVSNAETLCKIQAEYGVTGAFRNRPNLYSSTFGVGPISEWLAKMNPSTLDYRRAVENFTHSCAAYCVLTYVLGICDRHNDNIMLTTKGHLFHIDFGKFLGDSQMFGSFKRDRAPFVLTSDMLFVINEGEKVSQRFHKFVELCCQAFRIVRRNGDVLMNLFAMMATAGIPGVDIKSVTYIHNALLPECSNVEAAARFTRFIEDSSKNWFTSVNFFIHSLAQLRFASDSTDNPATLSFMPKMYSIDTEGRIESVMIVDFEKKYDPEKYYSYSVKVKRKEMNQPSFVNRTYKQFLELYSKLCMNFPMAIRSLTMLPRNSGLGRTNVKQVAEKRTGLLQSFLDSLFCLADEISHSDLVYTFFHPLLKDEEYHVQEEREAQSAGGLLDSVKIHGRIKACIQYSKGALLVLVLHAFDLACPNGQPPSSYVKSYLKPDATRLTKRKTRVIKRSQHPTFMEMLEYRLPLDVVLRRTLQLSVWHHDPLQENSFLGGVSIPLKGFPLEKETTETFTLGNLPISP